MLDTSLFALISAFICTILPHFLCAVNSGLVDGGFFEQDIQLSCFLWYDGFRTQGGKNMDMKLFEKANELIKTFAYASLGVIDEKGYPSVSAVSLQKPGGIAELYFTTTLDSNKVRRLRENHKASINCYTGANNITLVGEAEIVSDPETKGKYWQDWVEAGADVYPGGRR